MSDSEYTSERAVAGPNLRGRWGVEDLYTHNLTPFACLQAAQEMFNATSNDWTRQFGEITKRTSFGAPVRAPLLCSPVWVRQARAESECTYILEHIAA